MYSAIVDEPTKPTALMRGSVMSVSTASLSPLTTLSTPAGERRGKFPHRDHGREIERRDAGDDAERLPHRVKIDTGASPLAEFSLAQVRDAAGKLDHFEPA